MKKRGKLPEWFVTQTMVALEVAAHDRGLEIIRCGQAGHVQIVGGARLVNYWPFSEKRTAHAADGEIRHRCTPRDAVVMAVGVHELPRVPTFENRILEDDDEPVESSAEADAMDADAARRECDEAVAEGPNPWPVSPPDYWQRPGAERAAIRQANRQRKGLADGS